MLDAEHFGLDVIGHRLASIDAPETIRAHRIAAFLRRIVVPAARVPVADAERIATGGDGRGIRRREGPVVAPTLGHGPRLAGRGAAKDAGSNGILNGVTVFVKHDVRVLGVVGPAVAEVERSLSTAQAHVERVVGAAQCMRIDGYGVADGLPRAGVAEGLHVTLRAIDVEVGVHFLELRLAAIEHQRLGSIGVSGERRVCIDDLNVWPDEHS